MNVSRGAEKKQNKKDAMKAVRNDTKKNFAVISKSIQDIVQMSRNDTFKATILKTLKVKDETKIESKISELLNENYSVNK